ncbi:copper methylamine oxidase [Folsomia candida]|uniref:Amine oxidase n=1 Tax=Folsomia candida TaxID=158441 RepID=A0A226EZ52_FOLCA|nr:copper methylamine oxidase [Folsomia candida]OXA61946.1 Peroxisomal primary amine oxidase [Folsomia candida]
MRLLLILCVTGILFIQNVVLGDSGEEEAWDYDPHPLDPLSRSEINKTSHIFRDHMKKVTWIFIWVMLKEPEKSAMLDYFLEDRDPPPGVIPRKAIAVAWNPADGSAYEGIVDLDKEKVDSFVKLGTSADTSFARDEMTEISEMVLKDATVLERLSKYGDFYGDPKNVIADVWKYGYKGDNYTGQRMSQVYFYGRNLTTGENDNFYAHPMGFLAIVDTLKNKVVAIEELPIQDSFDTGNRDGDKVPDEPGNFDPEITSRWYRDDIKPINIEQPGGPSYSIDGNKLEWQNFKMRIGHNGREGLILHLISYNDSNTVRPLIYRASLSELFVPYGDPRPPYHRKTAMDVGEYGLGFSASELRSPDGCRGTTYFIDLITNDMAGSGQAIKNGICVYEEDAGILWRKMHTITGRVLTARSQRLVVTFITTVSNYDYQIKWEFYQDASIRLNLVLTGIVSQNLVGAEGNPMGHGTIGMPNVNAQYHQHFFTARLDVEIDGNKNTVSVVDAVPDVEPSNSTTNPYGNGFTISETVLTTPSEARTKAEPVKARFWRIIGDPNKKNPISGDPMGWRLSPDHAIHLMMKADSVQHSRFSFVDYDVWVTPYKEDQLYAGGFYLNSSGLEKWVDDDPDVDITDTDVVLWHVFGVTHIVRVEDLPVMPVENIGFWFKPLNFFTENPSVNVRPISRETNNGRRRS